MGKVNKKIGWGSLSLIFASIGLLFMVWFGDRLFNFLGLALWSNGNRGVHYSYFYTLPLFLIAFFLGSRYSENFGAKTGKIISLMVLVFTMLALFAF